jgi:type VI secretion system Hcp family effector
LGIFTKEGVFNGELICGNKSEFLIDYLNDKMEFLMDLDAFIYIENIEGESSDKDFPGWIEILDFSQAVLQTPSLTASSTGGAGSGRADFSNFLFRKQLDKSSPMLSLACAAGTHIDEIKIVLCRAGSERVKFLEYRMFNSIINKVVTYCGNEYGFAFPTESVGINFGAIQWIYRQQKRQRGHLAGQIVTGWSRERNCRM